PTGTRAIRRFVPMVWIDQLINLNDETMYRLKSVTSVLGKLHNVHQLFKLSYIIFICLLLISIVIIIELFMFNRRNKMNKNVLYQVSKDQEKELLSINNGDNLR
ncbi:unnamed protein product, partial [Rotaria sordida]